MKFYATNKTPRRYKCSNCGVSGVKLWRQYNVCADYINLLCAPCACANQKERDCVNDEGKNPCELLDGQLCDQIGSLVPAVPCEHTDSYWGYTSVPADGVSWWRNLPTRSKTRPKSRYIVVDSDGETWIELNQSRIYKVTPKQWKSLTEDGNYPKQLNCACLPGTSVALPVDEDCEWVMSKARRGKREE